MKYKSAKIPVKCPECGSERIANILYCMPSFSDSMRQDHRDEKIDPKGCFITREDTTWKCITCGTVIYKMKIDMKDSAN